jgi:hypothetical protein
MSNKKKISASAEMEPKFTKEALMDSRRFHHERDIVSALLKDNVEYSVPEVDAMIAEYMKGKVK